MHLVFVNWAFENHGSAQDLYHYTRVARRLGHEVVLYGPTKPGSLFNYSLDIDRADAVVFLFEFTTHLQYGDRLDWLRIVGQVPRHRRVVIDLDGAYNDAVSVIGDINHVSTTASRDWIAICDSLSDKIYQPSLRPLRPNVGTFFFHAYNPEWEEELDFRVKKYGMVYVGNNWFRWHGVQRVLHALSPIREEVGPVALVGQGWDVHAPWGGPAPIADAYYTDPEYLRRAGVQVMPPVRFDSVVSWMSKGVFTPVLLRPLFEHLRLVTCRTFETPAANVIPLFAQEPTYVREIYGDKALNLVLRESASEQIADVLHRPDHYAETVHDIRLHLRKKHSYASRIQQLIRIVES